MMRPIFVGGCGRSGTTLLAALLAERQGVVAPPEAQFLSEAIGASRKPGVDPGTAFAAVASAHWRFRLWGLPTRLPLELAGQGSRPAEIMAGLARAYAQQAGEPDATRWVDHTPVNVGFAATLLDEFPGAPLIHLVRDPRAVVASVLPLDWGPAAPRAGARWWLAMLAMGLAAEAAYPERVVRVRYEDLVTAPESTIEELCRQFGLSPRVAKGGSEAARLPAYTREQHALVGKPPDPARIDAWRSRLSGGQIATIEAEVRDVAKMLGYTFEQAPGAPPAAGAGELLTGALRMLGQRRRYRSRVRRALAATSRGAP
jgi:hypothetical protein